MSDQPESAPIQWRIDAWFPKLPKDILLVLKNYHEHLLKFNKTVNLISAKTIHQADALHFADSILASQVILEAFPKIDEIYDIGSGNGFPGLVLAILYPQVKVSLVDSDQRKCEFLKAVADHLHLKNVSVKNTQFEKLPDNSIKYGMARGLANISKVILNARKVVPKGGSFFHLKGDNWSSEVGEIPTQLCSVWSPSLVKAYKLPVGEFKFAVVRTEKLT